jgi:hypothetical protein
MDPIVVKGVVGSVIAWLVILLFLQPATSILFPVVQAIGTHFYKGFTDYIYANASLGHRNWVEVLSFGFFASLFLGGVTGASIASAAVFLRKDRSGGREERLWVYFTRKPRRLVALLAVSLAFLYLVTVVQLAAALVDLQANASFQQRLTILAPNLTDKEEKELRAVWAMMRNRNDYEEFNKRIEELARSRGVRLPPPLLR